MTDKRPCAGTLADLTRTLAQERDAFGKRETELMAALATANKEIERLDNQLSDQIEIVKLYYKEKERYREALEKIANMSPTWTMSELIGIAKAALHEKGGKGD